MRLANMAHELVAHDSKAVLEACHLHQLLVLVLDAPQRREYMEAEPLGLGHGLVVDKLGEDGGEVRLGQT